MNGNEIVGISDAVCNHHGHQKQFNLHIRIEIYQKFINAMIGSSKNEIQRQEYNTHNVDNNNSMCT